MKNNAYAKCSGTNKVHLIWAIKIAKASKDRLLCNLNLEFLS